MDTNNKSKGQKISVNHNFYMAKNTKNQNGKTDCMTKDECIKKIIHRKKNRNPNKNNPNKWDKHSSEYNPRPEELSEFDTVNKINPQTGRLYSHPVVYNENEHFVRLNATIKEYSYKYCEADGTMKKVQTNWRKCGKDRFYKRFHVSAIPTAFRQFITSNRFSGKEDTYTRVFMFAHYIYKEKNFRPCLPEKSPSANVTINSNTLPIDLGKTEFYFREYRNYDKLKAHLGIPRDTSYHMVKDPNEVASIFEQYYSDVPAVCPVTTGQNIINSLREVAIDIVIVHSYSPFQLDPKTATQTDAENELAWYKKSHFMESTNKE